MTRFRLHGLAAAMIALGGCASAPQNGTLEQQARFGGTTLADLESTDIIIEEQQLESASTQDALNSYRQAAELFDDPERRAKTLRRMADLALTSATEQEMGSEDDSDLEQKVDKVVYDNTMEQVNTTPDNERKMALLDLAGTMAPSLADHDVDYDTAISLYQELLNSTDDPGQRAEAYYLLSKAYAMDGNLEQAQASLDALVSQYPNSEWALESQFRRGEMLFSDGDYEYAEQAYADVIKRGTDNEFYNQALYKRGWSHYKLGDYELAQGSFFTLLDNLNGRSELADDTSMENKLFTDTQRVVSLAFSNLDGPDSVRNWFARNGNRDYEPAIYRSLGQVYLGQERFRDAAEAFDMFVQVYPDSTLAPEFSSLQIEAYQKGGFPTLVLPAKEKFIQHYGINSDYWGRHPDIREQYVSLLKGHILDLAEYHHVLAQQSGKPADYREPARWYQEYLNTPPASEDQGKVNHRYAEVLYAAEDYATAISEFERTAYQYPDYEKGGDAAFNALVAYQKILDGNPDAEQENAWRKKKIASAQQYGQRFPAHPEVPNVLHDTAEDQLALGDVEGAVKTAGILVNRQPPPSAELMRYGWATIANGEFDLGRFKVAEMAYGKLLDMQMSPEQRSLYREKLAVSIYRQAEQQQEQGNLDIAAATFLRVGQTVPEAAVRKNAEFDAATLFINQGRSTAAIPVLEAFRERYPDDPLTDTIPDKLAIAYEKEGNYTASAGELQLIAANYKSDDPELSRQALWKAAEMQDRAEQPQASIALYQQYLQEWPQPYDFRSEAQFRLVELNRKTGNSERETYWLQQLVTSYREAGNEANDRVAWLAAYASFTLAEPNFQEFKRISLSQPLKTSLAAKTDVMKKALADYQAVADIGVAEYATAANYKIGEMYRVLARDLIASERPKGLDELELEEYTMLLEDKAFPYEDQAIDILIANTNLVTDDIYDQWVKKSFGALAELIPGRYAKFEQVESYVDIIY
ncbi:Tetratricopeptide repeat-containing protein [Alcanivorax sp. DSM 26293]|uniref:tetratricopeptide repeat protein n=1 Tax=Alcanivorax sp. DSM 26293 TaxID=1798238 RepID=UPI0008A010DB|nr:tetratricopeptide repeat protein [Alcanivorax sp. DSM 26293]SEF58811.1 Tetratricopeptide repeat-containing protein [Alcanivorax sp. DSM 26293]